MENNNLSSPQVAYRAARMLAPSPFSLTLESEVSPARRELESLIGDKFAAQYGARLRQFPPYLLVLRTGDKPSAIVGLRPAREQSLFLESYLPGSAEAAISELYKTPVDRSKIVEIGSLVSIERGSSYLLFGALAPLLRDAGFRWVLCTATGNVEAMLHKMQFGPRRVCAASADAPGIDRADWGSYYDAMPHVISGDLSIAADSAIRANPTMPASLIEGWRETIDALGGRLAS